jgi:hypothetical protein
MSAGKIITGDGNWNEDAEFFSSFDECSITVWCI